MSDGDLSALSVSDLKAALKDDLGVSPLVIASCYERRDLESLYLEAKTARANRPAAPPAASAAAAPPRPPSAPFPGAQQQQRQQAQGEGFFSNASTWLLVAFAAYYFAKNAGLVPGMDGGGGGGDEPSWGGGKTSNHYLTGSVAAVDTHGAFKDALEFHKAQTGIPVVVDFHSVRVLRVAGVGMCVCVCVCVCVRCSHRVCAIDLSLFIDLWAGGVWVYMNVCVYVHECVCVCV